MKVVKYPTRKNGLKAALHKISGLSDLVRHLHETNDFVFFKNTSSDDRLPERSFRNILIELFVSDASMQLTLHVYYTPLFVSVNLKHDVHSYHMISTFPLKNKKHFHKRPGRLFEALSY